VKQFLIIKVGKDTDRRVSEWTPLPGIFTQEDAEELIESAMMNDPSQTLLMQEVGAA
jgi:hypothetical protein